MLKFEKDFNVEHRNCDLAQEREDCRMESGVFNTSQDWVGHNVTDLEPHTEYEFEVIPINPAGSGEISAARIMTDQASKSSLWH